MRICRGGRCWSRIAIGGPPIDVAVPAKPDTSPAATSVARVIGGRTASHVTRTAASTITATTSPSGRVENVATAATPTAVPSTRERQRPAEPGPVDRPRARAASVTSG